MNFLINTYNYMKLWWYSKWFQESNTNESNITSMSNSIELQDGLKTNVKKTVDNSSKTKGKKCYINNRIKNKLILNDELPAYLDEGWVKGRMKKIKDENE